VLDGSAVPGVINVVVPAMGVYEKLLQERAEE
jgi:hypothetical protein